MVSSLRQRELGRLLSCGRIKRALFIGPLPLFSLRAHRRLCVRLKCLRDLLPARGREPLRPHTQGRFNHHKGGLRGDADTVTVLSRSLIASSHSSHSKSWVDLKLVFKRVLQHDFKITPDLFFSFCLWCFNHTVTEHCCLTARMHWVWLLVGMRAFSVEFACSPHYVAFLCALQLSPTVQKYAFRLTLEMLNCLWTAPFPPKHFHCCFGADSSCETVTFPSL